MLASVRLTPVHWRGVSVSVRNRLPNNRAKTGVRNVSELRLVRFPVEAKLKNNP